MCILNARIERRGEAVAPFQVERAAWHVTTCGVTIKLPDIAGPSGPRDLRLMSMKRIAAVGLTMLLLWALAPAGGEILENALHFVLEGHSAHGTADGDDHDPMGPEHGCTDVVHLCSCCVSLSILATDAVAIAPSHDSEEPVATASAVVPLFAAAGIYRPPRA